MHAFSCGTYSHTGSLFDIIRYIEREKEKEDAEPGSEGDAIRAYIKNECPKNGLLSEKVLATILKSTLQGLQFLHSQSRVHRYARPSAQTLA